ncbi:MarR family winged helix-turn-helix transcriptional regulator [Subtercola boreus]|uniref:MarR family transcriptional regulator n=1 Tax=Subtercola boreus TaxID=120213 RepID=A0A3E0W6T6_9MICO|nr:MarR family winged helix-turn-helix transcriptional regulator [Subtercola boreus]RFA17568.1 MarR family transcriptional regulator [Subtercola boreus]RFA17704.1 MarR family transcriptional regulator [Subtercola boreus]RFA24212.1 MarR family transcriptional regulator [Subtercola boreus]
MTDPAATGRLLKRAQYRNHRAADRALATVGTTLAQWDALRAISESPGSSAHDLAITTFQSDQAFGTLANRLEAQKLIVRSHGHGRRVEHAITEDGRYVFEAGLKVTRDVNEKSFAGLTGNEVTQLHDLLDRVGEVPE